mmetsp:Transcript_19596/g.32130  ORF Transcript_19596/g.32130 Transcript_19596/m.32130 type:complete len:82 (+) Transcript_19596:135-380(+)
MSSKGQSQRTLAKAPDSAKAQKKAPDSFEKVVKGKLRLKGAEISNSKKRKHPEEKTIAAEEKKVEDVLDERCKKKADRYCR